MNKFGILDYYLGDVNIKGSRHFIFASYNQLVILSKAKTWFMDGTFHIVRDPVKQLWTINVFIRKGDEMMHVPTVCALMSSQRQIDYQQVLSLHNGYWGLGMDVRLEYYEQIQSTIYFISKSELLNL